MPLKTKKQKKDKKKKISLKRKKIQEQEEKKEAISKYFEAVGRRKKATARVRLFSCKGFEILINSKPLELYFSHPQFQYNVLLPFKKLKIKDGWKVSILVKGGGLSAQSEAIRLGISRALVKFNPEFKQKLKSLGFLTRDPRMRERKKFGLKRARRAPQWQKR